MAHVLTNTFAATSLSRPDSRFGQIRKRIGEYRAYRRTLADLRRLSPDELEDVGLIDLPIREIARVSAAYQH